jgi:N-acetylglucosamine kinase-like BadF-type ATPase
MILIADSGSTKTDWRLMDEDKEISRVQTTGFNPYYQQLNEIVVEIESALVPNIETDIVNTIYFYGAGCSTVERQKKVSDALSPYFPNARIAVHSDLLGAARALSGNTPGIVCILGTGSGSCRYDGEKIAENIPSLGFILGDEGSGAWLGKKMVTDFLRGHMPEKCMDLIRKELLIDKEIILEQVNHKPMPSRYLASFAKFISDHIDETYFYKVMFHSFTAFAENYIVRYQEYAKFKCHFVGSIAWYNQDILENVAKYNGFTIGNIIKSPIDGLTYYHSNPK